MKTEDRFARLEAQHVATFSLLRRLVNIELAHRALILAILDQGGLDLRRLEDDYDAYLLRFLEQVPPDHQDAESIALLHEEIFGNRSRPAG